MFAFILSVLKDYSKEMLHFMSKIVLWDLVLILMFRCLIHFEFTFVYGVGECSNFIILHVAIQFSQHHSIE